MKLTAIADPDMSAALLDVYFQLLSARTQLPLAWHASQVSDFFSSEALAKRSRATTQRIHVRTPLPLPVSVLSLVGPGLRIVKW